MRRLTCGCHTSTQTSEILTYRLWRGAWRIRGRICNAKILLHSPFMHTCVTNSAGWTKSGTVISGKPAWQKKHEEIQNKPPWLHIMFPTDFENFTLLNAALARECAEQKSTGKIEWHDSIKAIIENTDCLQLHCPAHVAPQWGRANGAPTRHELRQGAFCDGKVKHQYRKTPKNTPKPKQKLRSGIWISIWGYKPLCRWQWASESVETLVGDNDDDKPPVQDTKQVYW